MKRILCFSLMVMLLLSGCGSSKYDKGSKQGFIINGITINVPDGLDVITSTSGDTLLVMDDIDTEASISVFNKDINLDGWQSVIDKGEKETDDNGNDRYRSKDEEDKSVTYLAYEDGEYIVMRCEEKVNWYKSIKVFK